MKKIEPKLIVYQLLRLYVEGQLLKFQIYYVLH